MAHKPPAPVVAPKVPITPVPQKPSSVAPTSYYFLPYLSIQEQPKAPFSWTSNIEQNCNAQGSKCIGYDSNNNVFDSNIFQAKGAKLTFVSDATKGSYINNKGAYGVICTGHLGGKLSPDGTKCSLTAAQVQASISQLSSRGHIETFGDNNHAINLLLLFGLIMLLCVL